MDYPAHPITLRGQRIDIYIGKKNTMEELESLDLQAHQLMEMLVEWNQTLLEEPGNEVPWIIYGHGFNASEAFIPR